MDFPGPAGNRKEKTDPTAKSLAANLRRFSQKENG
jgi:hypothetical protein